MSSMDMLDVGQANEFKLACRRNDFTSEDLKWLVEGDTLAALRRVRQGRAAITLTPYLIDCDATPSAPKGWKVHEHQHAGLWEWNSEKLRLLYFLVQEVATGASGTDLLPLVRGRRPLNACVLDFLLEHPELIPRSWKKTTVCFWGTVYDTGRHTTKMIRALAWDDSNGFCERQLKLSFSFGIERQAAIFKH